MNRFKDNIDKQIEFNQGKNLFFDGSNNSLIFIQETIDAIGRMDELEQEEENALLDYVTDKALHEFCRINQYFTFGEQTKKDLKQIYADLFFSIRNDGASIDLISRKHARNLKEWLHDSNAFAEKIYSGEGEIIEPVACSEYSAELQVEILRIELPHMLEPVLDIGCGERGDLVMHLRNSGIEAFGYDRFSFDSPYFTNADWLEYKYSKDTWGTIISNLGFSNHFKHHHLREDGNFLEYGRKYMEILNSLVVGGSFHYAPDLPFIEQYLDSSRFRLTKYEVGDSGFKSIVIKRLK